VAGAARPPQDPAEARAEAVKQLSPEAITEAADQAARQGELERAIVLYSQAIEVKPSADLWFRVGWIYGRLGKQQPAEQAFANTLQLDPGYARAHEELGLLYLENRQREKSAEHLNKAVEIDPALWRSHNALGVLADTSQDYAAAIRHYEAALAVDPDSPLLICNLGYSHYLAGNLDRAEQLYAQALILQPGYPAATVKMGLLYARRADYERAVEVMGAAMDKAKAYNDVGYVAFKNGDLDVAEALFAEAIRLSPTYYETAQQNQKRVRLARRVASR